MRLWIVSDLHVELTRGWDLPVGEKRPRFDVLVVAGDLVPRMERGVKWLLDRVPDKPVIYVAGNHEAYGSDDDRTIEKAKQAAAGTQVFVLENDVAQIDGVLFAGATCWTDFALFGDQYRAMNVAGERMNDYRKIRTARYQRRFKPHHALGRHLRSRAFLEAAMRKPRTDPLVVVTHHAPFWRNAPQIPAPDQPLSDSAVLTAAYRSDLNALMWPIPAADGTAKLRPADIWIYGHTHESEDIMIGRTRIVSNAKGYGPLAPQQRTWDNPRFDPGLVIEI